MKLLIRLILLIGLIAILDYYTFQAILTVTDNVWAQRSYWIVHGLYYLIVGAVSVSAVVYKRPPAKLFSWMFSLFIALYVPKIIVLVFLLGEDASRLIRSLIGSSDSPIERIKLVSALGLSFAILPFLATIWGIIRTKYDYAVRKVKVKIKDLPSAFEGFTISQISDMHTGSFDNLKSVTRGIRMVNEQQSDIIVFTGDLVNDRCIEITEEYQKLFSSLSAREGVYSILGNHDYGDYHRWESREAKKANLDDLIACQRKMGWDLLLNENRVFERNGQKLALLGVENISGWGSFHSYGNIKDAYRGVEDINTKVLLSHDPTHWDAQVRKDYQDIDLTLSGHTHGMQFGIEFLGFKWSPVQYLFKQWAGLYTHNGQNLYVNRGFGFLGFSGRVGIRPEITVLELTKA